jgi:hypothetical protein
MGILRIPRQSVTRGVCNLTGCPIRLAGTIFDPLASKFREYHGRRV